MTMVMIMLTMLILLTLLMTISTRLMTIVLHSGAKAALVSPRFPLWGGLLGRSVSVTVRSSNLIIVRIIVKFLNIATIVKIMIVISQASLAFLLSFESSCTEQIFLSKWKRAFCKYQMAKISHNMEIAYNVSSDGELESRSERDSKNWAGRRRIGFS